MKTLQINYPSFKGAYRIKPDEVKAKEEIPQLFTQGKQVFNDILETGDKFIVLRDKYDKKIAKYIKENGVKGIEYFPEINTKSGLDDQVPEGLLKLVKDKTVKIITDINKICKASMMPKQIQKAEDELNKIEIALRLNIENPIITSNKSLTIVRDEEKKRTIEIVMPNKATTYVYVKPDCIYEDSIKCVLNGCGQIGKRFETPNEIIRFLKKFDKLKKENVNIIVNE